jgi:membrane fusion protein, multidrug efflux system
MVNGGMSIRYLRVRRRPTVDRYPLVLSGVVTALLALLPGMSHAQPAPGAPPAVGVVRAERQQITQTDQFIGRIQAVGRVALVARVTAFLEKRLFEEGAEVKKGHLLYQLEQPPFQAQVDSNKANVAQLEAQHRNAQLALERAQYLLKTPAGQQSTYDAALAQERSLAAQIEGAKAQLQQAEINLGYTEIRAPIDGKISATAVTEGNVVSPTSGTLANLVSQDPMYVNFAIAQRTGVDLRDRYAKIGGYNAVIIKLRLPNGEIYGSDGKLDYVSPTIAENTDTITLRGVVPNPVFPGMKAGTPGSRELTDGEFVTVLLEGVQPVFVLGIPRAAVLSDQQGDYVYIVDAQNTAQIRRIQLGQSTPSTAVITDGLKEGELVISEGLQRVRLGEAVSPGPASPPPAVSPAVAEHGASGSGTEAKP